MARIQTPRPTGKRNSRAAGAPRRNARRRERRERMRERMNSRWGGSKPARPKVAASPWDTAFEARMNDLLTQRGNALLPLPERRRAIDTDFGWGPMALPNPFSRAAELQRNYDMARDGQKTSFAAAGQHRSGAYRDATANTDREQQRADDAMRRQYDSAHADVDAARRRAEADFNTGKADALWQKAEAAAKTEVSPPPARSAGGNARRVRRQKLRQRRRRRMIARRGKNR